SCKPLSNVPINNGWATTNCGHGIFFNSLMCFADNGGWACAGGQNNVVAVNKQPVSSMYTGISSTSVNSCILQLGGIGLSNNLLSNSSNTNSSNSFSNPSNKGDTNSSTACENNNVKLLATTIPLCALLFLAIILVFYYRHKHKRSLVYSNTQETKGHLSQVVKSSG
ncbi:13787_t:CDS:1, partial [Cetraspora pellucida]